MKLMVDQTLPKKNISKLKNIAIETIQNETQREKTEKLNEQHMIELWEMLVGPPL